jgi:hypothetical protein
MVESVFRFWFSKFSFGDGVPLPRRNLAALPPAGALSSPKDSKFQALHHPNAAMPAESIPSL